jgi:hypothetical protein
LPQAMVIDATRVGGCAAQLQLLLHAGGDHRRRSSGWDCALAMRRSCKKCCRTGSKVCAIDVKRDAGLGQNKARHMTMILFMCETDTVHMCRVMEAGDLGF